MARGVSACEHAQPRGRARLQACVSPLAVPANRLGSAAGGGVSRREGRASALAAILPGGRLHLQHGPIDIVAEAFGEAVAVRAGYARAVARFATVLEELVAELPALRSVDALVEGVMARRMAAAVVPFRPDFITPMAAVAGAVAEEVLASLVGPGIDRAYANNGGDIAVWLAPGKSLTAALAVSGGMDRVTIDASAPVRGIATSGWRGRSLSLGIADAVTVLARSAAMADAAATMIANAVNVDAPGIVRRPAHELQCDSDLQERLVTVAVPYLTAEARGEALAAGLRAAEGFRARGLIEGAALFLQGETRMTGFPALGVAGG
jgi:uncharacterized protein